MKKNLIKILILLISVAFSEDKNEIQFQYGILNKPISNPEKVITLEDSSIIHTNDEVRVNIAYPPNHYFYAIFVGTDGEYRKLYIEKSPDGDTLYYDTALPWIEFSDPPGWETFYLITSLTELIDLQTSFVRYEKSKGKIKQRLGKKIQDILDNLTPSNRDIDHFASALEEPLIGGVTLRSGEDEGLSEHSVTHQCQGKKGIAVKKIVLNHR